MKYPLYAFIICLLMLGAPSAYAEEQIYDTTYEYHANALDNRMSAHIVTSEYAKRQLMSELGRTLLDEPGASSLRLSAEQVSVLLSGILEPDVSDGIWTGETYTLTVAVSADLDALVLKLRDMKDRADTEAQLRAALSKNKEALSYLAMLGASYTPGGSMASTVEAAKQYYDALDMFSVANTFLSAKVLELSGDPERAAAIYGLSLMVEPDNAFAFKSRGDANRASGSLESAVEDYGRAILLRPDYAEAISARADIYLEMSMYEQAVEDLTSLMALWPGRAELYRKRADAYVNLMQNLSAVEDMTRIVELEPSDADTYFRRGLLLHGLKRTEEALRDFTRVIELSPNSTGAYTNRGIVYMELGKPSLAVNDFSSVIKLNPRDVAALNHRGNAYKSMRQYNKAIFDFVRAIALDQKNADAYFNRGVVYRDIKQYDQSIADFVSVIELEPENVAAYYNLARAHALYKNVPEACTALGDAIGLGFRYWSHIKTDPMLENIRTATCYQKLMAGY